MSENGNRRSDRLKKLEEQKKDDNEGVDACRVDPLQIIRDTIFSAARGKGKKNGEIQVKLIIRSFGFSVSLCVYTSWFMYIFLQKLQGEASSSQVIHAGYTGTLALPLSCCLWYCTTVVMVPGCARLNIC